MMGEQPSKEDTERSQTTIDEEDSKKDSKLRRNEDSLRRHVSEVDATSATGETKSKHRRQVQIEDPNPTSANKKEGMGFFDMFEHLLLYHDDRQLRNVAESELSSMSDIDAISEDTDASDPGYENLEYEANHISHEPVNVGRPVKSSLKPQVLEPPGKLKIVYKPSTRENSIEKVVDTVHSVRDRIQSQVESTLYKRIQYPKIDHISEDYAFDEEMLDVQQERYAQSSDVPDDMLRYLPTVDLNNKNVPYKLDIESILNLSPANYDTTTHRGPRSPVKDTAGPKRMTLQEIEALNAKPASPWQKVAEMNKTFFNSGTESCGTSRSPDSQLGCSPRLYDDTNLKPPSM